MDSERFDAIAKGVFSQLTRRRTLSGLAGGALMALGLAAPEEAWSANKSGRCKRKCGTCEKCDKGSCKKNKKGKKKCKAGKCKTATGKTCTATEDGLTYTATCQSDKSCCRPSGTPCNDVCNPQNFPACAACCNGFCFDFGGGNINCN